MEIPIEGILGINTLPDFLILIGKHLGILDHFFDLLFCQPALVICDGNLLTLSSALVLCTNIENAVAVNLKRDFNLWLSTRSGRNSTKFELSKQVIVLGHGTLTLKNLDVHGWLIVLVSGEDLRLLGWDHCVTVDQLG